MEKSQNFTKIISWHDLHYCKFILAHLYPKI
jgi:hypothetical protein